MRFPLALLLVVASSFSSTQQVALGPHNNGGRGCPVCHIPHTGSELERIPATRFERESVPGDSNGPFDQQSNSVDAEALRQAIPSFDQQEDEIRGITICLSCHDGNIAKSSMLKDVPYDRRAGLIPDDNTMELSTFLTKRGNQSLVSHDYLDMDHPVGPAANFGKLGWNIANIRLERDSLTGTNILSIEKDTPEAYFAANYGFPALQKGKWSYPHLNSSGNADPENFFLLCTSCHNPHGSTGDHISRFFLVAPYNPNATFDSLRQSPSTTQFCRQCHFQLSNEYSGQTHIPTAY